MIGIPDEFRFRVSSSEYDSITALLWSHQFSYNFTLIPEHEPVRAFDGPVLAGLSEVVVDWCTEQFGSRILPTMNFQGDWTCVSLTFGFRRLEQATAFKIRWC